MATDQIKFTRLHARFINSHNRAKNRVEVTRVSGGPANFLAFIYRCFLVEDNDGAPTCYGLDNPTNLFAPGPHVQRGLVPLERHHGQRNGLANASFEARLWTGQPFYWAGLYATTPALAAVNGLVIDRRPELRSTMPDPHDGIVGKFPVVKSTGFYVSTTAQRARAGNPWEQDVYWNAAEVPYAVWATEWRSSGSGVGLGDNGLAINNHTGAHCEFAFRDTGTVHNVGECSRKLCRTLVPTAESVILVDDSHPISFIVFPHSRAAAGVGAQIEKLEKADNSDELPLFLSLGADLDRFKAWLRRFYQAKDYHRVSVPASFLALMKGLSAVGYPTDGIFHAPEKSVNV
jgi:hypothetical protein